MHIPARLQWMAAVWVAWSSVGAVARCADWDDLTILLPPAANAVLAIDVDGLFESSIAKSNQWREAHASNFEQSPILLPPEASRFVLSAELNLERLAPEWEFAVMTLSRSVSLEEIQRRLGGEPDEIGGHAAIRTPRGSFIVPYQSDRVALIRLAQRQWASRQMRLAEGRGAIQTAGLLNDAVRRVSQGEAQIAIAVLLADALPPSELRAMIERSKSLQNNAASLDQLAAELETLDGFVFSVTMSDTIRGRLEMVFRASPPGLSAVAKPLILDVLSGAGAALPDFKTWQEIRQPNRIGLEGELSAAGLRRVLSVLNVESTGVESLAAAPEPAPATQSRDPSVIATQIYVRRITRLVKDISTGSKADNLREQVLWTDRCASTISRMSTRDVQVEVAKLGEQVAAGLFEIVSTFQQAADTAESQARSVNRPPIEWRTNLIPYRRITTPFRRFYLYEPYSYARVNVWENALRSQGILDEELAKANQHAQEVFSEVEALVEKMNAAVARR